MKRIILLTALVFTVSITFNACKSEKREVKKEQVSSDEKKDMAIAKYQCPMKCEQEKTFEKEGECSVCKMKLRKIKTENHE